MATDKLTPSEAAMLLLLMAEAREIGNPELTERYGVSLTGKSREKLVELKLIESRKGARGAYFHQLSDDGWVRCNEGFDIGEVRPRATGQALAALLAGLRRYLDHKGLKLVHVYAMDSIAEPDTVAPLPAPPVSATPVAGSASSNAALSGPGRCEVPAPRSAVESPASAPPQDLVAAIRRAYQRLAEAPGDWVSLADLRPLLGAVDKAAVDQALTSMIEESQDVNLVPESNQKELTDVLRGAAVWIGGQHKHLISIGAA